MAGGQAVSAIHGEPWTGVACSSRQGQRRSTLQRLQRTVRTREADEPRHALPGVGSAGTSRSTCTWNERPGVLFLSYLLDDELRRLSSADRGELEEYQPSLPGRRIQSHRNLQSPGGP